MMDITEQEILAKIAATEHMKQLADIIHSAPKWRIPFERVNYLYKKIDDRRTFLKEKRRIVCLTMSEREEYIFSNTKYLDKSELVNFAKKIQDEVYQAIKDNNYDLSVEELKKRSLLVTDYLSTQNKFVINTEYAINIALNDEIARAMLKRLSADLNEMKINEVRQLLISLAQEISSAHAKYDHFCEHSGNLQECYQIVVEKYAHISADQFLQSYIHRVSAKRGMPIRKITNFILG